MNFFSRLAIIILILGSSIFYFVSSKNDNISEKSNSDMETETLEKNPTDNSKTKNPSQKNIDITNNTITNTISVKNENVLKKQNTQDSQTSSKAKIFIYEWNIDIFSREINSGNITFEIKNTGRFGHDFRIVGVKNIKNIIPGKTEKFTINLAPGNYTLQSGEKNTDKKLLEEVLIVK